MPFAGGDDLRRKAAASPVLHSHAETRQDMRLLNVKTLAFAEFRNENQPKYVIASHRWIEGSEVSFQDVREQRNMEKSGYKKIVDFASYVQKHVPTVEWLWVDTCCINKDSAAELSESINLMFDWYHSAELCIAYLADVKVAGDMCSFERSEWFKRGWTLQELLAPRLIVFVTATWQVIGHKGPSTAGDGCGTDVGSGLEGHIARTTRIPEQALHAFDSSLSYSVEQRLGWMDGRSTTREEDMSYALYGIFGVTPGANYGERREGARRRLLAAIHQQDSLAAQRADRFQGIVAWLSPPDPWTNHQSARQLHEPQTGAWLVQSGQYQSWKSASTRHLWVHGKAGCGKTVLCSTAVEDVKAYCERQPNAGYAVFYFSFSDDRKQRCVDLLCSLVVQLGWKGPALSMLQHAYDKPSRSMPALDELEAILISCFEAYDELFLVLDALDESPEDNDVRHNMLECLARLSRSAPHVKMFATSRELLDIRTAMIKLGGEPMSIAMHSVDKDIRQYTAMQLSLDHRLSRLDAKMKTLIEETISVQADGMFRWAYCQLQELKKVKATKPKYIKETLRNLPTTLDATYDRILGGIECMFREEAVTLLRWLAYAQSPLGLAELAEATIIDPTADGCVEEDERGGLEDTLEVLSGLVMLQNVDTEHHRADGGESEVSSQSSTEGSEYAGSEVLQSDNSATNMVFRYRHVRKDTVVRLAHFSVKEYLESKRILVSDAKDFHLESGLGHRFLANSCLVYLLHYSRSGKKRSNRQDLVTFPLLRYAARKWYRHLSVHLVEQATYDAALLGSTVAMRDWLLVHQPDQAWQRPFAHLMYSSPAGLYYASFLGLEAAARALLADGADVNARGGDYGSALLAASTNGYEKIVQVLIDRGANVNAQGRGYGTALQAASANGYEKIVQLLIDSGADVNAQGGLYSNALQAASYNGDDRVVLMLVNRGADVHAQGRGYGTALQAASYNGHEKIVQMLVDRGVDVNAPGWHYGTALQAALCGGHEKVVQMLMDAGAHTGTEHEAS